MTDNIAFEEAVIGSSLVYPDEVVIQSLERDDFFIHKNGWIWDAVRGLQADSRTIDILTVSTELEKRGQLEEAGGQAYLARLITSMPTSLNAAEYARMVKEQSAKRHAMAVLQSAAERLQDDGDPAKILAEVGDRAADVTTIIDGASLPLGEIKNVSERIEERSNNPVEVWGLRTGFPEIDKDFGGVHPGEVTLVSAGTGEGKTAFMLQLADQLSGLSTFKGQMVGKVPGAFYSIEMLTEELLYRRIARTAGIDNPSLHRGMPKSRYDDYYAALQKIQKLPIYISDRTDWTSTALMADVHRLIREHGIKYVCIDYAGLLTDKAESSIAKENIISANIQAIAKMGVAVIMVDKLNKSGYSSRDITSVYGSVDKSYNVHNMIFMLREDGSDLIDFVWKKARNAPLSKMQLKYIGAQFRFEPVHSRQNGNVYPLNGPDEEFRF